MRIIGISGYRSLPGCHQVSESKSPGVAETFSKGQFSILLKTIPRREYLRQSVPRIHAERVWDVVTSVFQLVLLKTNDGNMLDGWMTYWMHLGLSISVC